MATPPVQPPTLPSTDWGADGFCISLVTWGIIIAGWFVTTAISNKHTKNRSRTDKIEKLASSLIDNIQKTQHLGYKYWLTTDGGEENSQLLEIEIKSSFEKIDNLRKDFLSFDEGNAHENTIIDVVVIYRKTLMGDNFESKNRTRIEGGNQKIIDIKDAVDELIKRINNTKDNMNNKK